MTNFISHRNFPKEFLEMLHNMGLPRDCSIEKLHMTVIPNQPVKFDITAFAKSEDGKYVIENDDLKRITETYYLMKREKE
jgi:hypothetical protein